MVTSTGNKNKKKKMKKVKLTLFRSMTTRRNSLNRNDAIARSARRRNSYPPELDGIAFTNKKNTEMAGGYISTSNDSSDELGDIVPGIDLEDDEPGMMKEEDPTIDSGQFVNADDDFKFGAKDRTITDMEDTNDIKKEMIYRGGSRNVSSVSVKKSGGRFGGKKSHSLSSKKAKRPMLHSQFRNKTKNRGTASSGNSSGS